MIGVRIALQRHKLGMTQAELARRLCISASAVGMYEQGRREPSLDLVVALAEELGVSTDYLLAGKTMCGSDTEKHSIMISYLLFL